MTNLELDKLHRIMREGFSRGADDEKLIAKLLLELEERQVLNISVQQRINDNHALGGPRF